MAIRQCLRILTPPKGSFFLSFGSSIQGLTNGFSISELEPHSELHLTR
jgi:hypothetical protein